MTTLNMSIPKSSCRSKDNGQSEFDINYKFEFKNPDKVIAVRRHHYRFPVAVLMEQDGTIHIVAPSHATTIYTATGTEYA